MLEAYKITHQDDLSQLEIDLQEANLLENQACLIILSLPNSRESIEQILDFTNQLQKEERKSWETYAPLFIEMFNFILDKNPELKPHDLAQEAIFHNDKSLNTNQVH